MDRRTPVRPVLHCLPVSWDKRVRAVLGVARELTAASATSIILCAAVLFPAGAMAQEYTLRERQVLEVRTPGSTPYLSPLADFTGDGVLDFITGLWLFQGAGDGTFTPHELFTIPVAVTAVGDVDGDGAPDILSISPWFTRPNLGGGGSQQLELRLNRGGGLLFLLEQSFPHSWHVYWPAPVDEPFLTRWSTLADLDRNGLSDIVACGMIYHEQEAVPFVNITTLVSWRSSPSQADYAGFQHSPAIDPTSPYGDKPLGEPLAVDLNADGFLDIVATLEADTYQGWLTVLLNDGGRGFSEPHLYATLPEVPFWFREPGAYRVSAADVDNDSDTDLVVAHLHRGFFSVLLNSGNGSFAEGLPFRTISVEPLQAVVKDLNGDSHADALVVGNEMLELHMSFLEPGEPVRFPVVNRLPRGEYMKQLRVGDLNGDGLTDVIVNGSECELHDAPCTVVVLLGTLGGGFVRGDVEPDGTHNITDALKILSYLFLDGPAPPCNDVADTNDDGRVTLTDAIFLLNFLFLGGPKLPEPFPAPGQDRTLDTVVCSP